MYMHLPLKMAAINRGKNKHTPLKHCLFLPQEYPGCPPRWHPWVSPPRSPPQVPPPDNSGGHVVSWRDPALPAEQALPVLQGPRRHVGNGTDRGTLRLREMHPSCQILQYVTVWYSGSSNQYEIFRKTGRFPTILLVQIRLWPDVVLAVFTRYD